MRRIQDRRSAAHTPAHVEPNQPHAARRPCQSPHRRLAARRPSPALERRRLPSPVENQHHRHRTAPERCRDKELTTPHRRKAWGKWGGTGRDALDEGFAHASYMLAELQCQTALIYRFPTDAAHTRSTDHLLSLQLFSLSAAPAIMIFCCHVAHIPVLCALPLPTASSRRQPSAFT